MAELFGNSNKKNVPLGVYLIRKNLITERDIDTALAYQKSIQKRRLVKSSIHLICVAMKNF